MNWSDVSYHDGCAQMIDNERLILALRKSERERSKAVAVVEKKKKSWWGRLLLWMERLIIGNR
mgnify:CR=1 FL=1